jgi:hypothetical protein
MSSRLLMVGLPETGKTTFLAALYELVSDENPPEGALRLAERPTERDYFFEISQAWLKAQEVGHSNVNAPKHTQLPLTGVQGRFELRIPDVVGESFMAAWEGKAWPVEVQQLAAEADGVLLFVHATNVKPPVKLTPALAPDERPDNDHVSDQGEPKWEAEGAPTQTILADLLEAINELSSRPLPTVVVVSAWDAVQDGLDPQSWLQLNLPLLWQMLEGRAGSPPYTTFGVSAQGGDVTDPVERERLVRILPPRERIRIQHGEQHLDDISAPVRWLLAR